ncbi:MAG: TIGR03016 family PEP-CTERM system-associated outer membrane protein [Candidatus Scalindua sp.]
MGQVTVITPIEDSRCGPRLVSFSSLASLIVIFLLISGLPVSNPAIAADLRIIPELSVQETFTDNVTLSPSGSKSRDFISVINPGITINNTSQRLKADLNYRLQNIIRVDTEDDRFNLLDFDSHLEVLRQHLFLDFSVKNGQQNTTNTGRTASDNLSVTGDRSSVLTYSISPYWQQRLGNFADTEIRYTQNKVNSNVTDTNSKKVNFKTTSGARFVRLLWDVKFNYETIDSRLQADTKFKDITGRSRYLLTRKFALQAEAGYEDNDFSSGRDSISGARWNLGFEWNPSIRTSINAKYGRRFFGADKSINITHRTKRSRFTLKYFEEADTTRSRLLQQQVFNLIDSFGNRIVNPVTDQPVTIDVGVPVQTTEVFVRDVVTAVYEYTLRRNTIIAEFTNEKRDFELTGDNETQRHARLRWNWNIGSRTRSNIEFNWYKSEVRSGEDEKFYTVKYGLSRSISKLLTINVGLSYIKNNSNIPGNEYDEKRVFAGLNKTF